MRDDVDPAGPQLNFRLHFSQPQGPLPPGLVWVITQPVQADWGLNMMWHPEALGLSGLPATGQR